MWVARTFPRGVLSPRLMPGPCSFTARGLRLGRGPANAGIGGPVSKAGQSAVKFPNTSFQIGVGVRTPSCPSPCQARTS